MGVNVSWIYKVLQLRWIGEKGRKISDIVIVKVNIALSIKIWNIGVFLIWLYVLQKITNWRNKPFSLKQYI